MFALPDRPSRRGRPHPAGRGDGRVDPAAHRVTQCRSKPSLLSAPSLPCLRCLQLCSQSPTSPPAET